MTAVEIRLLTGEDAGLLASVDPEVFDDPIDPRAAKEFLADPRHHLAVALASGQVVGFASAVHYVHPDKPCPELWINEVGVAPAYRRRAVGKALLSLLMDQARALGCAEAWVLTDRSNTAAKQLYRSGGGVEAEGAHIMYNFRLDDAQKT